MPQRRVSARRVGVSEADFSVGAPEMAVRVDRAECLWLEGRETEEEGCGS